MMMLWLVITSTAMAFLISLLATPLAGRLSHRFGMLDMPSGRKAHNTPTPILGGCAIFAAILGPSLLATALGQIWAADPESIPSWLPQALRPHLPGIASKSPAALGILLGALALHVVGLIDDRKNLGPWLKLIAQILIASGTAILLNVRILTVAGNTLSIIVTIGWLVAIMNAFNFMDNMDGLAAGVAVICSAALLGASASIGQYFVSAWLSLLLGATAGFLVWNFPPAKIFMGDSGSLVIGYFMGVLSCLTTYISPAHNALYGVFVPLVLLAVPLYDAASVILLRLRERKNPMVGDRRHLSHRLLRRGMKVPTAVGTIYLCTAATAIGASLLPHVDMIGAVLVLVQTLAVLALVWLLERKTG